MIAIVKYNAGNIRSVQNALDRLGYASVITDDPEELQQAEKVIFPGVGEASSAMRYLRAKGLDQVICKLQQPVLGICLGLQLMCRHSEEGDTDCLGIFDADVKRFPATERVPHMGWNNIGKIRTRFHKTTEQYFEAIRSHFPPSGGTEGGSQSATGNTHFPSSGGTKGGSPRYKTSSVSQFRKLQPYARELRKNQTPEEKLLWSRINAKKTGTQFKRQKPVGPFIPDFVSDELKIIIEIDGEIHRFQKKKDAERQRLLESLGFKVLRFDYEEVVRNEHAVVDKIRKAVRERKSEVIQDSYDQPPTPSSGRGADSQKLGDKHIQDPVCSARVSSDAGGGRGADSVKREGENSQPPVHSSRTSSDAGGTTARVRKSALLRNISANTDFYYVHSYYADICEHTVAACEYIHPFSSVLQKGNFYATQFHPEKSADVGAKLLKNFLEL